MPVRLRAFAIASSSSAWVHSPSRTGLRGLIVDAASCVRLRTAAIVFFVVPMSLPICVSERLGALYSSQAIASGLSWRLAIGV